ncbi:hypothetical protein CE91St26_25230 [Akkermansia muciniphila]|nr:hypothetical protein CE91St26_25230 [Akkermansia muciniphila]GKI10443.1 hypothetical protein CE91St27_25250 [Akkermansia muciniphila]
MNNGFGQTVVQPPPTTVGFLYYRRDHNVGTQHDTDNSSSSVSMVPTFYEYNAFGNVTRQTLALAD